MTMLSLTRAGLVALNPCGLDRRLAQFRGDSMTALEALNADVPIRDLLWVAAELGRRDLCVRFALLCAQRMAHLNEDPRVQACLDAVGAWLEAPGEDTLRTVRAGRRAAAAAAAAAAVDAAAAAYAAAAAAAYAAAAAVDADAADAAADAVDAAYTAYAAAYAARIAERAAQRDIFIKVFCGE